MYEVLIDGGSSEKVLECLSRNMPFFDRTLEVIVATHPDKDHIGGLIHVMNTYKIDQIITNGQESETQVYKTLVETYKKLNIREFHPKKGEVFLGGPLTWTTIWTYEKNEENSDVRGKNVSKTGTKKESTNANSLTLRLEFGGFSALFTGDLEIPQEKMLISSGKLLPVTVLKIGHHGSNNSTSEDFLEKLHPHIALLGVGKKNGYGHPSSRVLQLLEKYQIKTFRTDVDGEIELETDGKTVWKTWRVI